MTLVRKNDMRNKSSKSKDPYARTVSDAPAKNKTVGKHTRPKKMRQQHPSPQSIPNSNQTDSSQWLYGYHTVTAALANPSRRLQRLVASDEGAQALRQIQTISFAKASSFEPEIMPRSHLAALLPPGAVHQGIGLLAEPLIPPDLETILDQTTESGLVVLLDQVTDPQNVGAVLRSAAAFGAAALIQTARHAPPITGTLAKAASGALEVTPRILVTNLARTLTQLRDHNFLCLGLAGEAKCTLNQAPYAHRTALVLGAEGEGLRRLTREKCDLLVRLPTQVPITTLNVAATAAIALYQRQS